ncbi:MAG: hypothetical protein DIU78_004630 [Pseudomonadota bacterium]|nr:MAG: hypothetical protein DIU78_21505 [Pseudomonadota bacterium]
MAAASTAVYVSNTEQYDRWRRKSLDMQTRLANDVPSTDMLDENARLHREAAVIQRRDDVALGLAIGAGVALSVSAVLWLTTEGERPAPSVRIANLETMETFFRW